MQRASHASLTPHQLHTEAVRQLQQRIASHLGNTQQLQHELLELQLTPASLYAQLVWDGVIAEQEQQHLQQQLQQQQQEQLQQPLRRQRSSASAHGARALAAELQQEQVEQQERAALAEEELQFQAGVRAYGQVVRQSEHGPMLQEWERACKLRLELATVCAFCGVFSLHSKGDSNVAATHRIAPLANMAPDLPPAGIAYGNVERMLAKPTARIRQHIQQRQQQQQQPQQEEQQQQPQQQEP